MEGLTRDFIKEKLNEEMERLKNKEVDTLAELLKKDGDNERSIMSLLVMMTAQIGEQYLSDDKDEPDENTLQTTSNLLSALREYNPKVKDEVKKEDDEPDMISMGRTQSDLKP